jgi:hypothetical protein
MDTTPLGVFVSKARSSNRLLYGDLRRVKRDVLPTGARTREEVEALLSLDWIERADEGWPRYLAMTVTEFVLSASDPPGVVDAETAAWLVPILSDARPRTASVIIRTLTGQAHQVGETLVAFVRKGAKLCREEPRPAEHRTGFDLREIAAYSKASRDPAAQDTLTIA